MKLMLIKFVFFLVGMVFIGAGGYAVALGMAFFEWDFTLWKALALFFTGLVSVLIGLWVWTK